ncbi:membrane protein, partial [Bacillus thuringiensis]|nr:membrane protein [Bacillus thuringiensis]
MELYYPVMIKLGLGLLCLIFQIHGLGKNLSPASAMDQVQDYVLGGIIG